ncbi:MAG TPA: serine hydrolase domain-containing protein [Pyrinomonadaceae bacterium]
MTAPETESERADKSAVVDALFYPWTLGIRPGGAVGIFRKGEVLHRKCYGFANLSTRAEIHPQSPFRLASLTKPFVAMAIMILEERGLLKYDDRITEYLPGFSAGRQAEITVRHLLTHTSGVEDYEELFLDAGVIDAKYPASSEGGPSGYEPQLLETVELIAQQRLRFAPGDDWEYSNSGYVLLASIAERVSGVPLALFLREEVFEPLGMRDTRLSEQARPEPKLSERAKGYVLKDGAYAEADYSPLNAIYGPDGMYSTLDDMMAWCTAALGTEVLVKSRTIEQAFTSGTLNCGEPTGYGFGWFVGENFGLPVVSHTGSWMGYRSFLSYYPSEELGVLVLGNFAEFEDAERSHVACALSKLYLNIEPPASDHVETDREMHTHFTGRYELHDGETFEIVSNEGSLWVNSKTRLVSASRLRFVVEGAESDSYFFHENVDGKVNGVTRHLSLFGYSKDADTWARKLNV